jgi:branched-subunit amino acid ABC-type transport system permease component/ABC-type branched-subunit amino acid transport system substrate-binding protein
MSTDKTRTFLSVFICVHLWFLPSVFAKPTKPIVVGAILEITGKSALAGQMMRNGIELALDEIGREHIEVVIEDNASSNSGSVNALNKLAGRGDIVALLAPIRSTMVLAMLGRINEVGVPTFTGATNENITRLGSRWIFRTRTDDGLAARLAARYAVTVLGARRIGILHETDAFGTGGMKALSKALEGDFGIQPVMIEKYHFGDRDYTGQLLNMRNAGVDLVILYCTHEADAGLILRRYRQLGMPYRFLGSPSLGTSIALDLARREAEGIHVFTDFSPERPRLITQAYRERYRLRYSIDPDLLATQAYDSLWLIARAAAQGATDPESLRRVLLAKPYEGAAGQYAFEPEGNGRHDLTIVQIENGRHRVIEVLESASSKAERLPVGSVPPAPRAAYWTTAAQLVAEGIAVGAVYALVAMGFVLLYNAASLVNFAGGELVMIAGYLLATLAPRVGLWAAFAAVLLLMAAGSVLFRRLTFDPIAALASRDFRAFVVTTLGASIFLKNLARLIWGARPALADSPFGRGSTEVAGVFVPYHEAGMIGVTIVALALLYLLFQKTMLGVHLRAVAQDRETAALMGIPVQRMIAVTFAGALMLAGLGGVLLAPIYFVHPEVGSAISLKAFCASIVGGFGSVPGAIVGGVLLGVAETLAGAYLSQGYRDGIAFILLIAVLIFRPSGLFGEKSGERA